MSFEDWLKNFDTCQICNLTPDTVFDDENGNSGLSKERNNSSVFSSWECAMFHGEWKQNASAGGRGQPDPGKPIQ